MLASRRRSCMVFIIACSLILGTTLIILYYSPERHGEEQPMTDLFVADNLSQFRAGNSSIRLPITVLKYLTQFDWSRSKLILLSPTYLRNNGTASSVVTFGYFKDDHLWDMLTKPTINKEIDVKLNQVIIQLASMLVVILKIFEMENYLYILPVLEAAYSSPARVFNRFETTCNHRIHYTSLTICWPVNLGLYLWHYPFSEFLPCDASLTGSFNTANSDYVNGTKNVVSSNRFKGIVELRDMFISRKMPIMLWAGSLLGSYRHCDSVPHSHDVDFGLHSHYYDGKIIEEIACSQKFKFKHVVGHDNESLVMTIWFASLPIDVVLLYNTSSYSFTNTVQYSPYVRNREVFPHVLRICSVAMRGYIFYVPCNRDDILLAEYGHHAMSLKKVFDNNSDPKNLVKHESFTKQQFEAHEIRHPKCHKEVV